MIRIIEEKNSGKTRKLMEACADNYGVFVCANPYAAREKSSCIWNCWYQKFYFL